MTFTLVTVSGTYTESGVPASGKVTFKRSTSLQDAAGNLISPNDLRTATLDANGSISIQLEATDQAGIDPTGAVYTVTEQINKQGRRVYTIAVPAASAGTGIDLADVAPVVAGPQNFTYALQSSLNTETTARTSADNTLQGNITSEASTRAAADTTLGTEIAAKPDTFLQLTDTPAAYTGQAGKAAIVNPGETGVIFGAVAGGTPSGPPNQVLATDPTGSTSDPAALRALVAADIPSVTHAKISDFDTQVHTSRLDQLAVPTSDVSLNTHKLTAVVDPASAQDAATKHYVDAHGVQSVNPTAPIEATITGTTLNIDHAASGATAGAYQHPSLSVDALGHVTAISNLATIMSDYGVQALDNTSGFTVTDTYSLVTVDASAASVEADIALPDATTAVVRLFLIYRIDAAPTVALVIPGGGHGTGVDGAPISILPGEMALVWATATGWLGGKLPVVASAAYHAATDFLQAANNLSDVTASTARTNLGLGTLATQNGTFSGTSSGTNTGDQVLPTDATLATSDVATNNVSITKHGFAPKAPNDTAKFLRGDASWATPPDTGFANPMTTQDDLIVGGSAGAPGRLGKGTDGQVLTVDPTTHHLIWATPAGGGSGTVTSVALTVPSDFAVSGSPITGAGTLAVTANTQSANTVKAGPSSGSAAAPTYRVLAGADLGKVIPALSGHPDTVPASPNAMDDEFDAGSLDAKWTKLNMAAVVTELYTGSHAVWSLANSAVNIRGAYQGSITTGTWRAKCHMNGLIANNACAGLFLMEAATSKCRSVAAMMNSTALSWRDDKWTNSTTFSSGTFTAMCGSMVFYLEIQIDSTNITLRVSADGLRYEQLVQETKTTSFTTAPDRIGLYVSGFNSASAFHAAFDWFRKVA